MKTTPLLPLFRRTLNFVGRLVVALLAISQSAQADQTKANNTTALNQAGSWVSGTVPGSGDVAIWDSTVTGPNNSPLGGAMTWKGIQILNPGGLVTIGTGDSSDLHVGSSGIDMSVATTNLTFSISTGGNELRLDASQIWNVASGLTLDCGTTSRYGFNANNLTLTLSGGGTVILGANNGNGTGEGISVSSGVTLKDNNHQLQQNNVVVTVNSGGVFDLNGIGNDSGNANINLNGTGIGGNGAVINSAIAQADIRNSGSIVIQSDSTINCSSGSIKLSKQITGSANLTKIGANSLLLNIGTTENFTGNYIINAGTFSFAQGGVLFNSASSVSIAAGATLDCTPLNNSGPFKAGTTATPGLSASGTGTAVGTTAALLKVGSGGANLGTRPITLTWGGATSGTDTTHPCLYLSQNALTLGGNAFTINGPQLGAGAYTLIQVDSGSINYTAGTIAGGTAVASGSYIYALSQSGGALILTVTAAGPSRTPSAFSGLAPSQSLPYGTGSVTLSGTLSGAGPLYPASGETVSVTINGNQQNTTISDSTGDFSINYNLSGIPASATPYSILYGYIGDASLFGVTNSSTALTITMVTPTVTVTSGSYYYNGAPQGPATYTTSPTGDTGTATWNYVGTGSTSYGPSTSLPSAEGTYTAQVSLGSDNNFNAASSSATAFTIGAPQPTMTQDTWPASGADVAGSQVTFTAGFSGATSYQWLFDGAPISDATNTTLTVINLQTTNSGSYSLEAINDGSSITSDACAFLVGPAPTADAAGNLVLTSYQNSTFIIGPSNGVSVGGFTPTWTIASGSLIDGANPSSYTPGSGGTAGNEYGFVNQAGAGGEFVLTDDEFPGVGGSSGISSFATLGRSGGAVTSVTYTLPSSANGYDVTNIQVYGGWTDSGRDHQEYTISYSTVSDPTTFITLDDVFYQPPQSPSSPTATHVTFESATPGSPMATNVAMIEFDFTTPSQGGDWDGYAQIQIFGASTVTTQSLVLTNAGVSGGNMIFTGTGGTPGTGYTLLTSTNVALPLADWTTNSTGTFDGTGSFSAAIPIDPSVPNVFYLFRTP